jgi:threonine dehydratase
MPATQIDRDEITSTERTIRPYIRRTPIIEADGGDFGIDSIPFVFKLEQLQHSGSFKARGAFANLLLRTIPQASVVAASGGNHGAAVAFAAMKLGVPAKIFVPTVASPEKIERIRSYGAELVVTGERYGDSLIASERWTTESGALAVHAYDQPETLLGQGSVGLELEQQSPDLDSLLVAVGGGGLIGGVASWYANRIKIVAVEPEAAPTLHNALEAGRPIDSPAGGIAADSLAPKQVGALMFPIAQKFVSGVTLVTDDAIRQAQQALWKVLRIVAEPGGAAALAAILSGRYRPQPDERVGVLVCGGNTAAFEFARGAAVTSKEHSLSSTSKAASPSTKGD